MEIARERTVSVRPEQPLLRGLAYPTIATPVRWDEVERAGAEGGPEALVFGPAEVLGRIERHGDLFAALR